MPKSVAARLVLGTLLLVALFLGLASPAGQALAQDEKPAAPPPPAAAEPASEGGADSSLIQFLFGSFTGWVLLGIYFVFIALLVWLFLDLRGSAMMPVDFIETFEEALNKRKYKEAFEMAKADHSMFGRVMTAGMTRLQHGLQEARDAAQAMIDSAKARKDHVLAYIAIIGTLGPLIGLVGTVSGMINSFGVLGRGGTPNPAKLAEGISHALNATLVGIFLSCLAIPAYSYFRNRLARIAIDASLLADDLLTQLYHNSRRPTAESSQPTVTTKSVPPATAQPQV